MFAVTPSAVVEALSRFMDFTTPVFIPSLVAFTYHSSLSLRTWLSVQKAPYQSIAPMLQSLPSPVLFSLSRPSALTRLESSWANLCHRFNLLATIPPYWLLFSLGFGMIMQIFRFSPLGVDADTFFQFSLLPVFLIANARLFATVTGVEKRRIYRSERGRPYVVSSIRGGIEQPLLFMPYLVAAFVSYRSAFRTSDSLSLSVSYCAVMHLLISSEIMATRSFKTAFLCAAANIMTAAAFAYSLTTVDPSRSSDATSLIAELAERTQLIFSEQPYANDDPWPSPNAADNSKWPLFIISVLWSVFPADLVSLCYRYDYHWHVAEAALSRSQAPEAAEKIPPPEENEEAPDNASVDFLNLSRPGNIDKMRRFDSNYSLSTSSTVTLVDGPPVFFDEYESGDSEYSERISDNESVPHFAMPYFCSSIMTWVFTNVALYAALQYSGLTSAVEFHYLEAISALITMPAMVLVVSCLAVSQHGLRALLDYNEQWSSKDGPFVDENVHLFG